MLAGRLGAVWLGLLCGRLWGRSQNLVEGQPGRSRRSSLIAACGEWTVGGWFRSRKSRHEQSKLATNGASCPGTTYGGPAEMSPRQAKRVEELFSE